jgi:hypothetical protein
MFDPSKMDYLFVVTADMDLYLIPTEGFTARHGTSLGEKYQRFRLMDS